MQIWAVLIWCVNSSFNFLLYLSLGEPYLHKSQLKYYNKIYVIVEWMTEYQRAARMPTLQRFNNLETCCWDYVIHETVLCMLKKWKHLKWLTWWRDCNTWCYDVGHKILTETMNKGPLYDAIREVKHLLKLTGHTHFIQHHPSFYNDQFIFETLWTPPTPF